MMIIFVYKNTHLLFVVISFLQSLDFGFLSEIIFPFVFGIPRKVFVTDFVSHNHRC